MSATTSTLITATELVRARLKAVPINQLTSQPIQQSVCKLIDQLAGLACNLSSSKWGGASRIPIARLLLSQMRLVTVRASLDCACITTPTCINNSITETTSVRALLQLQEEQKVDWQ